MKWRHCFHYPFPPSSNLVNKNQIFDYSPPPSPHTSKNHHLVYPSLPLSGWRNTWRLLFLHYWKFERPNYNYTRSEYAGVFSRLGIHFLCFIIFAGSHLRRKFQDGKFFPFRLTGKATILIEVRSSDTAIFLEQGSIYSKSIEVKTCKIGSSCPILRYSDDTLILIRHWSLQKLWKNLRKTQGI